MSTKIVLTGLIAAVAALPGLCVSQGEANPAGGYGEEQGKEGVSEDFDRAPVQCISMRQIEGTQIVDDQTILFYRRGGRVYMNLLEQECPTLLQNKLFSYRVTSGTRAARLCDFNAITVVDHLTQQLTYTCRLGMFHPIDEAQAEDLLSAPAPAYDSGSVVMEPVDGLTPIAVPDGVERITTQ
jgi:hypothetical protein